jgi:diguanylate cyclase
MRYTHSAAESAKLLRQALPYIGKHGGRYVPTAYTVWYEHLAGLNPALSEALKQALANPQPLGAEALDQLYWQFVELRERRALNQLQTDLTELLQNLGTAAARTGESTAAYTETLTSCEERLGSITDTDGLMQVLHVLVESTRTVHAESEILLLEVSQTRQEMTRLRNEFGTLRAEALTDPLSGLRNRRGYEESVHEMVDESGRLPQPTSVLVADIDHFKRINDSYGHGLGDQVIRATAQVIQGCIKGRDLAVRWGGEEFLVVLPETPLEGALAVAEQIRTGMGRARIRRSDTKELIDKVTISLGAALVDEAESLEQAIGRADHAMLAAKAAGRDRVQQAEAASAAAAMSTELVQAAG